MAERQYRVEPAAGVAMIIVQLKRGQIVSDDPEHTPDGDWLPVKFRGWMHKSILAVIDA